MRNLETILKDFVKQGFKPLFLKVKSTISSESSPKTMTEKEIQYLAVWRTTLLASTSLYQLMVVALTPYNPSEYHMNFS